MRSFTISLCRCLPFVGLVLAAGLGCSGKTRVTTTVTGTVTYNSAPVSVGAIYFHGGDNQVGMGNIGEDGSFTATDVPVGEVRVSLQVRDPGAYNPQVGKGVANPAGKAKGNVGRVTSVPTKFADPNTSNLKYTIEQGMKDLEVKLE